MSPPVVLGVKRSAKGVDTHKRVLDHATALFAERGYAAVGLQEIAEAAGLSKASLFAHFDNKRQIYVESVTSIFEAALGGYVEPEGVLSSSERLSHYLSWILPRMSGHGLLSQLILRMLADRDIELMSELLAGSFGVNHRAFMQMLKGMKTQKDETVLAFFVYAIFTLNDRMVEFADLWTPDTRKKVGGVKSMEFIEALIKSW